MTRYKKSQYAVKLIDGVTLCLSLKIDFSGDNGSVLKIAIRKALMIGYECFSKKNDFGKKNIVYMGLNCVNTLLSAAALASCNVLM
jgi:hypothetical protein